MADTSTPNASQIATELGNYFRTNNREVRQGIYQKSITAKFMRTVTAVQGKFPALQSITGRVVQGFKAIWSPLGVTEFKVNELRAYQQKVNFPITPANILNSWISYLYEENKKPQDMSISKYIVDMELMPAIVRDREDLIGKSVYDPAKLDQFGHSMDGIQEIIRKGVADGSMFQIPIATPTLSNMVDQVEAFELGLPEAIKPFLTKVYMSTNNMEKYMLDYRNKHGLMPLFTKEQGMKTYIGQRDIVALPSLNGTNVIFATPDQNFLRLIDIIDEAVVTDVQVLDYVVKIFCEWWEGVGFWTNQLVVVAVPEGTHQGLGTGAVPADDAALNAKYFGGTANVPSAAVIGS
ncbi:hypothetical protein [Hymenobacter sp. PAMC 26628]|uniref:hypothetical protein n=1 Tax=Hymenobacter sp. PAMC 26628 TaxID=1484118 RepID=UPI0007706906|nr:hypothetical protein [Hymenobacter sp. PAMC 26628]AMJ65036.1 hypothetical protein AXW84_06045 [Hymenobacter sp. PAMC 26628]